MPRLLRMPSTEELPPGPRREFVEELFVHYREAGRPTLREIAQWITDNAEARDLRGTASTETIRRVLSGATVPRTWYTVETLVVALCGIANRSPDEERWPEDSWGSSVTFLDEVKRRWNAVLDQYETAVPMLPPRPTPPAAAESHSSSDDPWATSASARSSSFDDEPPF